MAVGFALLVNLALASSFVWRELLPNGLRNGLWAAVGVYWVAAAVQAFVADRRSAARKLAGPAGGETLERAFTEYLKGNWFETERILVGLLHFDDEDVEARLLLATLLRRRRRWNEASAQLDRIEQSGRAAKWEQELRRERLLLQQALEESRTEITDPAAIVEGTAPESATERARAA